MTLPRFTPEERAARLDDAHAELVAAVKPLPELAGRHLMTDTQTSAADELRAILERCSTVYAVVHHVSRSGMQRRIDFYVISGDRSTTWPNHLGNPFMCRVSHLVAKVLGLRLTDDGVVVKASDEPAWDTIYELRKTLGLGEMRPADAYISENVPRLALGYGFEIRYL